MKTNNAFDGYEISILIDALSKYKDSEMHILKPELHYSLILSTLNKLENINTLTYFTKQEYSIMHFAMEYFANLCDYEIALLPYGFYKLFDKTCKLASA